MTDFEEKLDALMSCIKDDGFVYESDEKILKELVNRYRRRTAALEKIENDEHRKDCNCFCDYGGCDKTCPERIAKEALNEKGEINEPKIS